MRPLHPLLLAASLGLLAVAAPAAVGGSHTPLDDPIPGGIRVGAHQIALHPLAGGFTSPLMGITAPGLRNRLFVVDQPGRLWSVNMTTGTKRLYADLTDIVIPLGAFGPGTYDERGFLGAAFDPNFQRNGLLYTYTSERTVGRGDFSTLPRDTPADHQNVIREWHVADPSNPRVGPTGPSRELVRIDWPQFNHNGGAMQFGPDGMLYVSMGDGGNADDQGVGHDGRDRGNAQNTRRLLGEIIRIDPHGNNSRTGEYGVPRDNPFVGVKGFRREIYAYGFRNPWRMSFDRATGRLWVGDVGQNDIEEVDIVRAGGNYGWRVKEGTFLFEPGTVDGNGFVFANSPGEPAGMVDPVAQYDHDEGVALIGGFVYRGHAMPALRGRYIFGEFSPTFANDGRLFYLNRDLQIREALRPNLGFGLLGFGQDARGELYALGHLNGGAPFGNTGTVYRLVPER